MDCFDLCRFIVTVKNQKIVNLKGDPEHPLTRGVICPKAKHLIQRHHHPQRIVRPLIRTSNGFVPASYDRVFDLLADNLTRVKNEYGSTAFLNYTSDGYGGMKNRSQAIFFNYFGGDSRFSGSLCWSAGMAAQKYDFGQARGNIPSDVLNSDLVILWGRNPRVTNLHLYTLLKRARKTGTKIIVIDPVETQTAKAFGTHIRVAPGTDGALALGMAHVLIMENLIDQAFIMDHVKGYQRFRQSVQAYTPDYVKRITGVPAEKIRELAVQYGKTPLSAIYIGYGMQRYANGGNAVRSIDALAAITGHIGKSGAGINYASKSLAPYLSGPEETSEGFIKVQRRFPAPCLGSFMEEANDPPIQMGFFSCGNPLVQTPDLTRAVNSFASLPLTVVFEQFMTDTASMADLVLPAATVFEQEDIFVTSMYSHVLNYSQKAVDPPGTLMPEFEFYLELGRRLGLEYGFLSSKEYLEQCAAPLMAELRNNTESSVPDFKGLALSYTRMKSHDLAWADYLFETPSGKIEVYSENALADGLSPLPEFTPPLKGGIKFPLRFLTCHTKKSMHSQGFMDKETIPEVNIHPDTASRLELGQGDRVRVKGENGEIIARVIIDKAVYKNTAFMHQGYWHKSGAVNFLTRERVTDMGNQAAYYDNFCSLVPV